MKSASSSVAVALAFAVFGGLACVGGPGPLPDSLGEQGQGGSTSGDDDVSVPPESQPESQPESCEPGAVRMCRCDGGTEGARQCRDDGRSFSDCICPDLDGS
jgi:hypothetical protein